MMWLNALAQRLPEDVAAALDKCTASTLESCTELRIRAGGVTLCGAGWRSELAGIEKVDMRKCVESMTRGSRHMLGECVKRGFIPLPGGFRAGICGRAVVDAGEVAAIEDISGICIRISRDIRGAADMLMPHIIQGRKVHSTIILSPPGLGKTTLLRDIARAASRAGLNTAIADERGELSDGIRQDKNTDVLSMCPKAIAIGMLVRTMKPDVIITDELGAADDARAVADAIRCGTSIIASAHADSVAHAASRAGLDTMLASGLFERMAVIAGPAPGENIAVFDRKGQRIC